MVTARINRYLSGAESPKQPFEGVIRIVDESREMDCIRKVIEDKGLDPIWETLIAGFGALMYTRGRRSAAHIW